MRNVLMITTAAITLLTATSAMANNRVDITQSGTGQIATTAQEKGTNGKIEVNQSGQNNKAIIKQRDADIAIDRGSGAATAAFIEQIGHDNQINTGSPLLGQRDTASGQGNIVVSVSQNGFGHVANYSQTGDYHNIMR